MECFDAYQGYFFALPELSRSAATPTRELGTLAALAATDLDTSLETLESIVQRDAGLSHKLLRYANSAHVSPLARSPRCARADDDRHHRDPPLGPAARAERAARRRRTRCSTSRCCAAA